MEEDQDQKRRKLTAVVTERISSLKRDIELQQRTLDVLELEGAGVVSLAEKWTQRPEPDACVGSLFAPNEQKVYALKLEGGNYYVGRTRDVNARLKAHFDGQGAVWTKLHRPIALMEIRAVPEDVPSGDVEKYTTLEYMRRFGVECVRGGPWSQTTLISQPRPLASFITPTYKV